MISVQNHLRLLSGNNVWVLLFIGLCWGGCSPKTTSKVQTTPTKNMPPKKYDALSGKSVVDTEVKGPITEQKYSNTNILADKVSTTPAVPKPEKNPTPSASGGSTIALILPFMGGEFQSYQTNIPFKSTIAVEYYAGAKLALQQLSAEGHDLTVKVHDSQANSGIVDRLVSDRSLADAGLIMGGIKSDAVVNLSKYAAQNSKTFVSPLIPALSIQDNCPSCYQFNPSFETHSEVILNHAKKDFAAEDIILMVRSKGAEVDRLQVFNALNAGDTPLKEMIVNFPGDIDVRPLFQGARAKCFIIPSWSNEGFIQEALRVIRIAKQATNAPVRVYGMPQWLDMEKLSYDNFEELDLHISTSFYIDKTNPSVSAFRTQYFNTFGKDPSEFAYKGYDITYFFAKKFVETPAKLRVGNIKSAAMLHTKTSFINQRSPDSPASLSDYWENHFVQLLKFYENSFKPIY